MEQILKYPRTHHIEGSRLQPGDEDLTAVPFREIMDKALIVEEKMDGSNCAVSFSPEAALMLQSRGHYLSGGGRERHFALFKTWATTHGNELWELLGTRYIMYGEWLYAKHTVFYDLLPHYFMEFDVYDRERKCFLSTEKRTIMLNGASFIHSVFVVETGQFKTLESLVNLIGPSRFISENMAENLIRQCEATDQDQSRVFHETDTSGLMEGLYIKHEDEERVFGRYKYVRAGFLTTVINSESHWMNRKIIPNGLADPAGFWGR